jgi:hypothetical protein
MTPDTDQLRRLAEHHSGHLSSEVLAGIDVDAATEAGILHPPQRPDWVAANPDRYKALKPKQKAFLKAYAQFFSVKKACAASKIAHQTHRDWLFNVPDYRAAFESCKDMGVSMLEDEATRRAVDGVEEPIIFRGEVVGSKTVYSDPLLIKLLEANRPEKYRNRTSLEHSGPGGGAITMSILDNILKDDQ